MALVFASGTLTAAANAANTETVTIGGKVYTFQDTLTNVDGNVKVGVDAATSLANLAAAINLGAGAGTAYAAAMTTNPHARAFSNNATTVVVRSKLGGTIGNFVPTTEAAAQLSWGAALLAGGTGNFETDLDDLIDHGQMNGSVAQSLRNMIDPSNVA